MFDVKDNQLILYYNNKKTVSERAQPLSLGFVDF